MTTSWTLPRESREFIGGVTVTVDNLPVTVFDLALVPERTRPAEIDWSLPVAVAGKQGLLVGPGTTRVLAKGIYNLWVRYDAGAEKVVLDDTGTVMVT